MDKALTFREYKKYIISDYRAYLSTCTQKENIGFAIIKKIITCGLLRYVFIYRIGYFLYLKHSPFLFIFKIIHSIGSHKYGIQLPITQPIGKGLRFMHYSCIVISAESIGDNCVIFQGVTIGHSFLGKEPGRPKIGDRVVIFAGAKVFGNITIGNDVIIGANCVVNRDVPNNCIVVGNPCRILEKNPNYIPDDLRPHLFGCGLINR